MQQFFTYMASWTLDSLKKEYFIKQFSYGHPKNTYSTSLGSESAVFGL